MACNMGEVATVAAWLDAGNDPDEPYNEAADGHTLLFAAARSSQEKLWSIFMLYLSFREALRSRPESAANLAATWYASVASRVRWT